MAGSTAPRRNIAVIAVHGVGDQKPLESAHAIGDLLLDLDKGEHTERAGQPPQPCVPPVPVDPRYEPFTTKGLRINVRPVVIADDTGPAPRTLRGPFNALVDQLYLAKKSDPGAPHLPRTPDDLSTTFMRGQLRCYGGDTSDETLETVRLEGTRTDDNGSLRSVHIYELYWADLSRLKAGLLSIFTELYQLLFHLSSLGTHVVDSEASQHLTPAWQRFRNAQGWAAFALGLPIPALNIFALAVTGIVAATAGLDRLPPGWRTVAALTIFSAVVTGAAGVAVWRSKKPSPAGWIAPVVAWLAFVLAVATFRARVDVVVASTAAQVVLVALAGLLVDRTLLAYDARRPRARVHGWMVGGTAVAIGGVVAVLINPAGGVVFSRILAGWVRVFEVFYASLVAAWSVFAVLAIWAFVCGELAVRGIKNKKENALAERSRSTARLMLSLPAAAFLSTTLAGWAVLSWALQPWLGGIVYRTGASSIEPGPTVGALTQVLLTTAGTIGLPVILVAAAVAALPAVWGLAPVVWAEVRPPALHRARSAVYSTRLGNWLTRTFGGLAWSGWLLVGAMTFVFPALGLHLLAARLGIWPDYFARFPIILTALQAAGAASGIVLAWLFAIRGDLKKLAIGFAPVLDILLDVDNWLREHPLSRNPKARICGRYVSLLRYMCAWTDPLTSRGYDAIVIVAHSQGTVITADLLRFLARERDTQLARLGGDGTDNARNGGDGGQVPIYLFTMGCPLRQLYGERFPRLYSWAMHDDDAPMDTPIANDLAAPHRTSVLPDPGELRVTQWINAYRSGDYIGRHVWRTDPCAYLWTPDLYGSQPFNSTDTHGRVEFCLGAGAHTHYWDSTARPIAWTLDKLIEVA